MLAALLLMLLLGAASTPANYEARLAHAFGTRWIHQLNAPELDQRVQAVQAFLAFPELGLPHLRNSLATSESTTGRWPAAFLLGLLGERRDVRFLLNPLQYHREQLERPEVWRGALERLYLRTRTQELFELQLTKLSLKVLGNEIIEGRRVTSVQLDSALLNRGKNSGLVEISLHLWGAGITVAPQSRLVWLVPETSNPQTFSLEMSMAAEGDPIRLDFWVHHVGSSERLLHQKALLPLRPQLAPDNATATAAPADSESPMDTPSQ
jgi:hypothetical protein